MKRGTANTLTFPIVRCWKIVIISKSHSHFCIIIEHHNSKLSSNVSWCITGCLELCASLQIKYIMLHPLSLDEFEVNHQ